MRRRVLAPATIIRLLSSLALVCTAALAQTSDKKIIGTWCGPDGNGAYMCLKIYESTSDGLQVDYGPLPDSPLWQPCRYTVAEPGDHIVSFCPKYHITDAFINDGGSIVAFWEGYPSQDEPTPPRGTAYLNNLKP